MTLCLCVCVCVCVCKDLNMFPGSITSDSDRLKPHSDRIYFSRGGSDLIFHVLISDFNPENVCVIFSCFAPVLIRVQNTCNTKIYIFFAVFVFAIISIVQSDSAFLGKHLSRFC